MQDLKSFIYENKIPKEGSCSQRKASRPFSLFELTVNFRSHYGIVRYAASLVELIYTLFPNSIDVMEPEFANTPGPPPLLFVGPEEDFDQAEFMRCLLGQIPIEHVPAFSAQQVIIVRSESTARLLTQRLQKRCTVITLLETKGLEFDDVLLYNFFAESEAPTTSWKNILLLSAHNKDGRVQFQYKPSEAHATILPVLCYELKQLYVAITRARHRCWLWDSGRTIDAMKVFWEGLKLIKISDSLNPLCKFAASSQDLWQWDQRGKEFFSTGLYPLAQLCFERAGKGKEAAIADAYNIMTKAKAIQGADAEDALIHAAEEMETCAKSETSSNTASTLWYHAATCWHGAQDVCYASEAYCNGGFYDQAAVILFEAQEMDECLKILVLYSGRIDPVLVQRIEEVAAAHPLRERIYDNLKKLFNGNLDQCIALAHLLRLPRQIKELLQRKHSDSLAAETIEDEVLQDRLTPDDAAYCIQVAWRRAAERQAHRRRLDEFSSEGQLYEENRCSFPKVGDCVTNREVWASRLIRGPYLSIALGLQMLVAEMENYLEHIDYNLMREDLSPKRIAEIQKSNKRDKGFIMDCIAKAHECLPRSKPAKLIKSNNIGAVRIQAKNAWNILMKVKDSKTVSPRDDFKMIETLIRRGRDLVLKGYDIFKRSRHK
ncbi:unnamed protein product, partial [Rhizoctonia solani]